MYEAELVGTTSKIENTDLGSVKSWLTLVSPYAFTLVDWAKVDALPVGKQLKTAVESYTLVIKHHADPETEETAPTPSFPDLKPEPSPAA